MTKQAEPTLTFSKVAEWDAWLAKHHARSSAVLLRIPKRKGSDLTYARALDAALSWGWIDSQKRALDASAWLQRFSRRTANSPWSKINRARAEALIASGAMKQAGLDQVERARADGRWTRAYDGSRTAEVPADLATALARNPRARTFFDALDHANRFAILWRVQDAKKPETRARRIEQFVALCAAGKTLHPPRKKRGARRVPRG
ncbi:MAG: YdeI family protein [Kofleriaceae bacterium]